jgi:hypothetical protein
VRIERQVPPVARVPPVADAGDAPVRHRFEVDDEVYACAVRAVDEPSAEDHLAVPAGGTCLARCEAKRGEDRIQDDRNSVECRFVRRERMRTERHKP